MLRQWQNLDLYLFRTEILTYAVSTTKLKESSLCAIDYWAWAHIIKVVDSKKGIKKLTCRSVDAKT